MGLISRPKNRRMVAKHNRMIVVLVSDTHAGHKLGLLHEESPLIDEHGDEWHPQLTTVTQRFIHKLYHEYIEQVAALADGCPVILIHNGDITHGVRYAEHLALVGISDQVLAAAWNLRPWFVHERINLSYCRITTGTAVHSIDSATEILVGHKLSDMFPKVETKVVHHSQIELVDQQGEIIDSAHHGPYPGSRAWLKGNSVRRYLQSAMIDEMINLQQVPRVYVRSHYHEWLRETARIRQNGHDVESDLVVLPSFCGIDDYVRRATRSKVRIDLGLVALEFENGLQRIHPLYQELNMRTREAL